MSRADTVPALPSRPTLLDLLLVVSGVALSVFLSRSPTLHVVPAPPSPPPRPPRPGRSGGFGLWVCLPGGPPRRAPPAPGGSDAAAPYLVPILPQLVRLPEGVILLWPAFLLTQRALGRKPGLT